MAAGLDLARYFQQGDAVLAAVFWLLASMSLLTWFVLFWKAMYLAGERWHLHRFARERRGGLLLPALPTLIGEAKGPVRPLVETGLMINREAADHPGEFMVREVAGDLFQHALDRLRLRRETGLSLLASIGTSAPFIGLFGTVWGVYRTLTEISAQQSASLAVVSGPMGEALVATAFGLFVAIPAVVAYNGLTRFNGVQQQLLQQLAERLQHSCLYHPDSNRAEAG